MSERDDRGPEIPETPPEDDVSAKFARFVGRASGLLMQAGETVKEQATRGREVIEGKIRERDLQTHFQLLGKEVYKRVAAGEFELPPSLNENIDAITALIKERDHEEADDEG